MVITARWPRRCWLSCCSWWNGRPYGSNNRQPQWIERPQYSLYMHIWNYEEEADCAATAWAKPHQHNHWWMDYSLIQPESVAIYSRKSLPRGKWGGPDHAEKNENNGSWWKGSTAFQRHNIMAYGGGNWKPIIWSGANYFNSHTF